MIARKRYRLAVVVARTIRAGGTATVKVRLPKPAADRLRGKQTTVAFKLSTLANGQSVSQMIRVTIKGRPTAAGN